MQKPNNLLISIYNIGIIKTIDVEYRQTGNDTADTFIVLRGISGESMSFKYDTFSNKGRLFNDAVELKIGYNYCAVLKPKYKNEVKAWMDYHEQNQEEYNQYLKLKEKFGE